MNKNTGELEATLETLKKRIGMGFEVNVRWLPNVKKHKDGKRLLEEVSENMILIYEENEAKAADLLYHGFVEWLLNQHTRKYRLFINKLIELFEQIQYNEKEKMVEALTKVF